MKKNEIDDFETLQGQFDSFYQEMSALAKKNPNDALNKFKLGLVNSVLKRANTFLGKSRLPFADFECFDDATMPSTSDVLLIVSQYLSAFEKLRSENIFYSYDDHKWHWTGNETLTGPPKKIEE